MYNGMLPQCRHAANFYPNSNQVHGYRGEECRSNKRSASEMRVASVRGNIWWGTGQKRVGRLEVWESLTNFARAGSREAALAAHLVIAIVEMQLGRQALVYFS